MFPWRPTNLSPTFTWRSSETSTWIFLITPGSSLCPKSRLKIFTLVTLPCFPCSMRMELSLTSLAFSPKMARSNRSSGVSSASPFGEIFPTRISLGPTEAPTRIIPSSSKSFSFSSPTFGISEVVTSSPSFVSRTSQVKSSIWMEVNSNSLTSFSEMPMESSKPMPRNGKKHTKIFLPKANLPLEMAAPSASTSPFLTCSPLEIIGFWWKQEYWLVLTNVCSSYVSSTFFPPMSYSMVICEASTSLTTPLASAKITCPESRATFRSTPVPTNGASGLINGTAWRCMFEPIRAREASSFCKNGISAAAEEINCLLETSE